MKRELGFEHLEDRVVLSGPGSICLDDGWLNIDGTNQADTVHVDQDGNEVIVKMNGTEQRFDRAVINKIQFNPFRNCGSENNRSMRR